MPLRAGAIGAAASDGNVITINGTGIDIALTDANGDPLDGDSSGLFTTGGRELARVFLWTDPTNNNIVLGTTTSVSPFDPDFLGDIVFAMYLQETGAPVDGAKMWTVQYESLDHLIAGTTVASHDDPLDLTGKVFVTANQALNFNFTGAPSGSNLFMTFGDPNTVQIVVVGQDPLNQSQGGNINTKDVLNISQAQHHLLRRQRQPDQPR